MKGGRSGNPARADNMADRRSRRRNFGEPLLVASHVLDRGNTLAFRQRPLHSLGMRFLFWESCRAHLLYLLRQRQPRT